MTLCSLALSVESERLLRHALDTAVAQYGPAARYGLNPGISASQKNTKNKSDLSFDCIQNDGSYTRSILCHKNELSRCERLLCII
jgi:hypothetical protein